MIQRFQMKPSGIFKVLGLLCFAGSPALADLKPEIIELTEETAHVVYTQEFELTPSCTTETFWEDSSEGPKCNRSSSLHFPFSETYCYGLSEQLVKGIMAVTHAEAMIEVIPTNDAFKQLLSTGCPSSEKPILRVKATFVRKPLPSLPSPEQQSILN